jgi:hypothetical protein
MSMSWSATRYEGVVRDRNADGPPTVASNHLIVRSAVGVEQVTAVLQEQEVGLAVVCVDWSRPTSAAARVMADAGPSTARLADCQWAVPAARVSAAP